MKKIPWDLKQLNDLPKLCISVRDRTKTLILSSSSLLSFPNDRLSEAPFKFSLSSHWFCFPDSEVVHICLFSTSYRRERKSSQNPAMVAIYFKTKLLLLILLRKFGLWFNVSIWPKSIAVLNLNSSSIQGFIWCVPLLLSLCFILLYPYWPPLLFLGSIRQAPGLSYSEFPNLYFKYLLSSSANLNSSLL